ncbi:Uve UV damage repair endonuclease [uncultured Caudovirales phage]|uniref:Uve UV damage repair endonuclease n=1 Tax=uncultured Caudovirales phage TaxID=2100421 RepID=A0A6J5LJF1_9CAUD|nr:Uve UV damage repair endonuclease [uncultured Caudovirales phage]
MLLGHFQMQVNKIGFACKWIDNPNQVNGIKPKDDAKIYNTGTTTVAWLNRQTREVAEQKLWDLMVQNIEATRKLVERVGNLNDSLRMVRISSDVLPVFTHNDWKYFWSRQDVIQYCEQHFRKIGDISRDRNVRLSMHPGQFTVLASDNPNIVTKSIEEFEYHATMANWMGFAKQFQDFKINVHISGKQGTAGIRSAWKRLSPEARNTLTIENEEIGYGLDKCLTLSDLCPIVLDIHHHWIKSSGEYISPSDPRVQMVVDSWRGIRPTMHYSVSREDLLVGADAFHVPVMESLLGTGHNKQTLRAHSDFFWNSAVNNWALEFNEQFDIMCEAKGKNLASLQLYNQKLGKGLKQILIED